MFGRPPIGGLTFFVHFLQKCTKNVTAKGKHVSHHFIHFFYKKMYKVKVQS